MSVEKDDLPGNEASRENEDHRPLISALELETGSSEHPGFQSPTEMSKSSLTWRDWPHQIYYIMGNEVCERFSFYGMRAILVVHMIDNLHMSAPDSEAAFHVFTAVCYGLPLLGAWIADNLIGKYACVLYFSGFYCLGHAVLALWETKTGLAIGVGLVSLGAGAIKPCVSAMVGDQFDEARKHLLISVFALFYWCINLGSFASMMTTPLLLKYLGSSAAFSVPGIFMAIALAIFWSGRNLYILVMPTKERAAGFLKVILHCLPQAFRRNSGKTFWDAADERFTEAEVEGAKAVAGLLKILACLCMFQALYDQHSSTWVVQAKHMNLDILGWEMPPAQLQAINPVLVLTSIPLFEAYIYPWTESLLGLELTPLRKMSSGMVLAGFSFLYVSGIQVAINAGAKPLILWQTPAYAILTVSEVLVSTTGLQFAYTQAPPTMKSTIMSLWLMTVFVGNVFDAVLTKLNILTGLAFFLTFSVLMFIVALLFIWAAVVYKTKDYTIRDSETKSPTNSVAQTEN